MGACFDSFTCEAKSDADAIDKCEDYMQQCRWETGNDGYSGDMGSIYGATMTSHVFESDYDARKWLNDNTEKRAPALGVKVLSPVEHYMFGASCPS